MCLYRLPDQQHDTTRPKVEHTAVRVTAARFGVDRHGEQALSLRLVVCNQLLGCSLTPSLGLLHSCYHGFMLRLEPFHLAAITW
eukprot:COSAG01_NODE_48844_length_377_cov_1.111511_1_plen_84_part_00